MKNIWMVLFFLISLNAFCQGINDQPIEIKYVPIRSLNVNNSINILDIDDYIAILNDKKINIVLITDSLFAFESNSIIYTISRNGYKTLTDFFNGKKNNFKDSLSYYTALELNLTSQEELDKYQEELVKSQEEFIRANYGDLIGEIIGDKLLLFNHIMTDLVYPPIALRSGIEGRVILELFVDKEGNIEQVLILQESPPERGFGEAAVKIFIGKKVKPARANGEAVSTRFRYPVSFRIK
jgi:TonB family protein